MSEVEIINHIRIPGLTIFVNSVDHRTPHMHSEWELIWVLENKLTVICGSAETVLAPGQMILLAPDEPHEFHKVDHNSTFLCMQIAVSALPIGNSVILLDRCLHQYMPEDQMQELKKVFLETASCYLHGVPYFELRCLGNAVLMLHEILQCLPSKTLTQEEQQRQSNINARLKRVLQFVDANYMHKVRLRDLAEQEGCSVSYLSRIIKEGMGQTFQECVDSVRFHHACKLISAGWTRMLDVCIESGYSDYRYFIRAFRDRTGLTPDEYRKKGEWLVAGQQSQKNKVSSREYIYSTEECLSLLDAICL